MHSSPAADLPPITLKHTPGLGLAVVLLVLVMAVLFVLTTFTHSPELKERAAQYFTEDEIKTGMDYGFERRLTSWGQNALNLGLLLFLVCGGWGRRLADFWDRYTGKRWLLTLLLVGVTVYLLEQLVALPLRLVSLGRARDYWHTSTQTTTDWLLDHGKSILFGVAMYWVVLVILFGTQRLLPRWWWLVAALVSGAVAVVFALLVPVVVSPLFNNFTPLQDQYLLGRFERIGERANVPVREVLVMDASRRGKHTNAYFTGFGDTRRIVVYDNLLRPYQHATAREAVGVVGQLGSAPGYGSLSAAAVATVHEPQREEAADEIESILAHEVGHYYHDHIVQGIVLGVFGALVGFFVLGQVLRWAVNRRPFRLHSPTDPAAIPLVFLLYVLGAWAVAPVENVISRHFERQADQMSLDLARKPDAFIEAEKRLVRDNLANVAPSPVSVWFYSSHPPAVERIEMAEEWRRENYGKLMQP
jgi:STE24 endopeptidase